MLHANGKPADVPFPSRFQPSSAASTSTDCDLLTNGSGNSHGGTSTSICETGSTDSVDDEEEKQPKGCWSVLYAWPRKKKATLISLAVLEFTAAACLALLAPFFPVEVESRGLSDTVSGMVFSCYGFVMFVASPIIGRYIIPRIGLQFVFLSGCLFTGTCSILFGLLDDVTDKEAFVTLAFIVRSAKALGAAAFSTASFTYVAHGFPESLGAMMGTLETFSGLGLTLGPVIGGGLYTLGGYKLPFFAMGTLLLMTIPINYKLLPKIAASDRRSSLMEAEMIADKKRSFERSYNKPKTCFSACFRYRFVQWLKIGLSAVICIVAISIADTFLDPVMEPYLGPQFGMGPGEVSLMFLVTTGSFTLTGPVSGWFSDKFPEWRKLQVAVGILFTSLAFMLMGPSPFFPFFESNSIGLLCGALLLHGVAIAICLVPTFSILLDAALDTGYPDTIDTFSTISGIWQSSFSLGETIGPFLGGAFLDLYGFSKATTTVALIIALSGLMVLMEFLIFFKGCSPADRDSSCNTSLESSIESGPLLKSSAKINTYSSIH